MSFVPLRGDFPDFPKHIVPFSLVLSYGTLFFSSVYTNVCLVKHISLPMITCLRGEIVPVLFVAALQGRAHGWVRVSTR